MDAHCLGLGATPVSLSTGPVACACQEDQSLTTARPRRRSPGGDDPCTRAKAEIVGMLAGQVRTVFWLDHSHHSGRQPASLEPPPAKRTGPRR